MKRASSARGIAKARVYPLKLAARLVGVSEPTLRKWSKQGLRIINERRPYLVRGEELIDYLNKRHAHNQMPMRDGQIFCMTCKSPREPQDGSVVFSQMTTHTGHLSAICASCGGKMSRFCRASERPHQSST